MVAVVAVVAVTGTAVWFWPHPLTKDEEPFVGTWTMWITPKAGTITLLTNHRLVARFGNGPMASLDSGAWWVRDGDVFLDYDPNPVRRTLRPVLERVGVGQSPILIFHSDEFYLGKDSPRLARWRRVETKRPADL
jgi:hypothetical protein